MNVHGPKKEYGLQGFAGLVQKTRARSTGTEVGLYAAGQAGMESDPETPWCTVCEEHFDDGCCFGSSRAFKGGTCGEENGTGSDCPRCGAKAFVAKIAKMRGKL